MEKRVLKITDTDGNVHYVNFDAIAEVFKKNEDKTIRFLLITGNEIVTNVDFSVISGFIERESLNLIVLT